MTRLGGAPRESERGDVRVIVAALILLRRGTVASTAIVAWVSGRHVRLGAEDGRATLPAMEQNRIEQRRGESARE